MSAAGSARAAGSASSGSTLSSFLSSGGLSSFMGSVLSSSLLGGSGSGSYGLSAAGAATSMAAQSLLKAYSNAGSGNYSSNSSNNSNSSGSASGSVNSAAYKAISSSVGNRDPEVYREVLDSLDVENNPRYAPNEVTGSTYCNVYLLDATEAMGAAIPRYTDRDTGEPSDSSNGNAIAMNANRISDWLNKYGEQYGWYEVTQEQAQALANKGCPAVTTWRNNSGGHGHVQVVSPSEDGLYDPERGVAIAQAGRNLRNYTYIRRIYSSRMAEVQYFAHR